MSGHIPTLIHVGFGHSGTTSLQQNFFARHRDIFYCTSTGDHGGILSFIKYEEDWPAVEREVKAHCDKYIWRKIAPNQSLVLSDETLVEQPEVYYTPQMLPIAVIAQRLKQLFPNARILFTLRNQLEYVVSCYLNLKRNYAYLANRCIEDFDTWFSGNHSQIANLYLRNLDYSRAIAPFVNAFGKDAVAVLPLESLARLGHEAFLRRVGDPIGIETREDDVEDFRPIRNRRISAFEDRILTRWRDPEVRSLYDSLAHALGPARLRAWLDAGGPTSVALSDAQVATIRRRAGNGNRILAREFGLNLAGFGYPIQGEDGIRMRMRSAIAGVYARA